MFFYYKKILEIRFKTSAPSEWDDVNALDRLINLSVQDAARPFLVL